MPPNSSIKVSVIIPVFNAAEFLDQCLYSIREQTLHDIEIICVDDGSTDTSWEILQRHKKEDSRIHIFQQNHGFAGRARNLGLSKANGQYLSFLDSDDFFEPSMLERAYLKAEAEQLDIVCFRCNHFDQISQR